MISIPRMAAIRLLWAIGATACSWAPHAVAGGLASASALVGQAAQIPFLRAQVISADGRSFDVAWSAPVDTGDVALYASDALDATGALRAPRRVARGSSSGDVVIADLPPAVRWYFELRPAHGRPLIVADRSLHLSSAPNFRDVGGYRTSDGRWVKMGLAYRSTS